MFGYVYLTENLINGKCYIGQHKAKKFDPKYKGSGHALLAAIEKYGWDNFVCQPIAWANSKEELDELEVFYIAKTNAAYSSNWYNLTVGGECGWEYVNRSGQNLGWSYVNSNGLTNTPESQAKRVQTIAERRKEAEARGEKYAWYDMSGENNPMYGVHRYGEDAPMWGYHFSEESKQKMSATLSDGRRAGVNNNRARKVLCIETNIIYDTIKDACEATGATKKIISACKTGKTSGGYHWTYVN